ncbi:hypothetical protein tb265_39650 [Gemmatimonadetes bacterium T265]|nr:hypothetical protein tb265_39650 [Gemmatimonadetes bacterium T265]
MGQAGAQWRPVDADVAAAARDPRIAAAWHAAAWRHREDPGKICCRRDGRTVEYVRVRGDLVLLMGEERAVPGEGASAGREVRRPFTDS